MVQLAIAGHPGFAVSDLELRRPGPSYTVDTLTELAAGGDELFFVIGSETFLDLLSWREPRRIAALVRLVVIPRAGSPFDPQSAAAQKVLREIGIGESGFAHVAPGAGPPPRAVLIAHVTSLPISASDLRRRVRAGRSLDYRVPPPVIEYVRAPPPLPGGARVSARPSAAVKAQRAARIALDRKALDLVVLDVQALSSVTDFFLVCSGRSTTHVATIADAIRDELKADGVRPLHVEGVAESGWVLLDYGDVLMHVFLEETRVYYALERLWGDAPSIPVDGA